MLLLFLLTSLKLAVACPWAMLQTVLHACCITPEITWFVVVIYFYCALILFFFSATIIQSGNYPHEFDVCFFSSWLHWLGNYFKFHWGIMVCARLRVADDENEISHHCVTWFPMLTGQKSVRQKQKKNWKIYWKWKICVEAAVHLSKLQIMPRSFVRHEMLKCLSKDNKNEWIYKQLVALNYVCRREIANQDMKKDNK